VNTPGGFEPGGALHAEKFHGAVSEEFSAARDRFRWHIWSGWPA